MEKIESGPAYMAGCASAMDYRISRGEKQSAMDAQIREAFADLCRRGDANAMASFAPTVSDSGWPAPPHARRRPLLHEVMAEALDLSDEPYMAEVMQLVLNVANDKGDGKVNTQTQARALLDRMIGEWAKHCGPEVSE